MRFPLLVPGLDILTFLPLFLGEPRIAGLIITGQTRKFLVWPRSFWCVRNVPGLKYELVAWKQIKDEIDLIKLMCFVLLGQLRVEATIIIMPVLSVFVCKREKNIHEQEFPALIPGSSPGATSNQASTNWFCAWDLRY